MLQIFIIFFFVVYCILELTKRSFRSVELNGKTVRLLFPAVCYIKLVSLSILIILLIANRFSKSGIVERSAGIESFFQLFLVMGVLIGICIFDLKKVKKQRLLLAEEGE